MPLASRYRIAKKSSGTKQYEIKRDKEKIVQDDISRVLESREAPFDEKQKITESIIDEMRLSSDMGKFKNSTLNSSYLMYAYFFGFLFAILAAGLLLSLPMISATVLGVDMLTRIGGFIEFYHIIIVFAVAALNVLCYWICWVKSRHDRIGSLKKSIKVTLLYGILPVAVYVIAYAIAYFAL